MSDFLTRPDLVGSFGMSASTHWVATGVAQSVLERGGNAFDAAVAAGLVMHVVEPHLNGPGGDLVALVAPAGGPVRVVCGQGPAPRRATIAHYRGLGMDTVPGSGTVAAAVPGAFEAWLHLLREHGTWDVADVVAYAVHYAETGQPLAPQAAAVIAAMADHFAVHWPTSADQWLVDGRAPEAGNVMAIPAYARTLRRLLEAATGRTREERIEAVAREWRTGFVARAIDSAARQTVRHADGGDYAGVLDGDDLAGLRIATERPVSLDFRGVTVSKASFWSQGPVLLQALAILDHFDGTDLDPGTERGAHTVLEALKLAMADRDAYYGDAGGDPADLAHLLSAEYAQQRAALITDRASGQWRPGTLPGRPAYQPTLHSVGTAAVAAGVGEPTVRATGETRGDTVHIDVADRWGNLVSVTPSGGWLQSNPTIPELGFCLGTRLQMTWLDPTSPSALAPGRRPRTTLTPTVLSRDGVPIGALGSPGGDQQDQWQLLYLLRTIVGGQSPQQAIDAPTLHTTAAASSFWPREWSPRGAVVEDRIGNGVIDGLRRRGHAVTVSGGWTLGRLSAVGRDPASRLLWAAANPRGMQGYAAGR